MYRRVPNIVWKSVVCLVPAVSLVEFGIFKFASVLVVPVNLQQMFLAKPFERNKAIINLATLGNN